MSKILAVGLLSLAGTVAAVAKPAGNDVFPVWNTPSHGTDHFMAPEIDPSSALSALTLLVGGLTVMRGRFAKR